MAELADIESVLVATIAQAVYPNGTAGASATGTPARIYRGWPIPNQLDADLKAGTVNISVYPLDQERNLTKNPLDWIEVALPEVYLTLTVAGNTVTVGGMVTCPLNASVTVNGTAYAYPLQATDTPTSVATALSALIGPGSSSSGPVITIPNATISAAVGAVGGIVQEIRRQIKSFRISLWCSSPPIRDAMASAVDSALAQLSFVNLPDGTSGRILYVNTHIDDAPQKALLFRRDFVYSVEYSTTNTTLGAAIVATQVNVNP